MEILNDGKLLESDIKKSIFPDINLYSFSSIPPIIKEKREEIGNNVLSFYDKNVSLKKVHKKNKSMLNKPINKIQKTNIIRNERRGSTYLGESENRILPRQSQIAKILYYEKKKRENELILSDEDNNQNNNIHDFFFTSLNENSRNKENELYLSLNNKINHTNESINISINTEKKKIKKKKLNKSINYFNSIQKDLKLLDYENTITLKQIKRDKKNFQSIETQMNNLMNIYKWKYLMTDSDKDLRPDTFFGKAGQEIFFKQAFNKRLDSMINNLKGKDFTNLNMNMLVKNRKENKMTLKLNKRIQEEKEKRKFINNLLDSSIIIYNGIIN